MRGIVASTLTGLIAHVLLLPPWRGGRVAECTGLENRRRETVRGFKSHPLRHIVKEINEMDGGFRSGYQNTYQNQNGAFGCRFLRLPFQL